MQSNTLNTEIFTNHQKANTYPLVESKPNLRLIKKIEDYTDNELVESFVSEGNELVFNEIFNRYHNKIKNLAIKIIYDIDQAEEIVQEVFITLLKSMNTFRGESKFSTWLYSITLNTIKMKLRENNKNKANLSIDDNNSLEKLASKNISNSYFRSPEDVYLNIEFIERLHEALELIPTKYRETFILSDLEQHSNLEIADQLGLSVPAVKSRLHRARKYLRTNLSNH